MIKIINKNRIAVFLSITLATVGHDALASNFITPFDSVPANHWSYSELNKLLKDGVIDSDENYAENNMDRYHMAVLVAKALSKYDAATAADKASIDRLLIEYSEDLKAIGVRRKQATTSSTNTITAQSSQPAAEMQTTAATNLQVDNKDAQSKQHPIQVGTVPFTEHDKLKLDHLPNFGAIIKSYYDNVDRGTGKHSHLYQDVRMSLYGDINDQWGYHFEFLYRPNEGPLNGAYNDFRSTLDTAPGMSSNGAALIGQNVFDTGTTAVLGYQWIGVRNDNWVYNNGLKGISLFNQLGKVNVAAQYGVLDLVYNHGFSYHNDALVFSAFGDIGNTYVGGVSWHINDKTNNYMYHINELQIKQPIVDDWLLNLTGAKSNDDTQDKLYSIKISKGFMDSKEKGSYHIYTDYHYVGTNATLGPDGDRGISNAVGLKGVRFGLDYAVFKGVQMRTSYMPWDKQISDNSHASVFNWAVYVEI